MKTTVQTPGQIAFKYALAIQADRWVPANGGTETSFMARSGNWLLYCFNPHTGKHAYLNVNTDLIMSDDEARQHLAL